MAGLEPEELDELLELEDDDELELLELDEELELLELDEELELLELDEELDDELDESPEQLPNRVHELSLPGIALVHQLARYAEP